MSVLLPSSRRNVISYRLAEKLNARVFGQVAEERAARAALEGLDEHGQRVEIGEALGKIDGLMPVGEARSS